MELEYLAGIGGVDHSPCVKTSLDNRPSDGLCYGGNFFNGTTLGVGGEILKEVEG